MRMIWAMVREKIRINVSWKFRIALMYVWSFYAVYFLDLVELNLFSLFCLCFFFFTFRLFSDVEFGCVSLFLRFLNSLIKSFDIYGKWKWVEFFSQSFENGVLLVDRCAFFKHSKCDLYMYAYPIIKLSSIPRIF